MSGIPGSGKSTYVNYLTRQDPDLKFSICSADHYFQKNSQGKYDTEAEYKFDPSQLSKAHGECLRKFMEEIVSNATASCRSDVVIVDNTSTTSLELAPYVSIAMAYNIPTEIITVKCDPHLAAERNLHGVSYSTCMAMDANIKNRSVPGYWNVKTSSVDDEDY